MEPEVIIYETLKEFQKNEWIYEMEDSIYESFINETQKFEIRQTENKFIKKLQELVFREDVSDENFRKFVMNYIQAGGIE